MEPHATGNATITIPAEKLERSSASAAEGQSGRTPSSSSGWRPGDAPPSRQPGGEPSAGIPKCQRGGIRRTVSTDLPDSA